VVPPDVLQTLAVLHFSEIKTRREEDELHKGGSRKAVGKKGKKGGVWGLQ
jgi:hypothetical protein